MGRSRSRVLLGACLASLAVTYAASAQDQEQYALLAPRRPSVSSESATPPSSTGAPSTAASEMTLQAPPPTTDAAAAPAPELVPPPTFEPAAEVELAPRGFAGPTSIQGGPAMGRSLSPDDFVPIPDRWRIGFPTGYRPEMGGFRHYYDPYNQNVLKGDYPIWGNDKFLEIIATSDTLFETRRLPTPSGVSSREANSIDFFGQGKQFLV